jgi:RecB family endonuclease NucS
MIIKTPKIGLLVSAELNDDEDVSIVGSEADMARMIYERPYLISKDFKPVSLEEQTKYGFIDVMGHNGKGVLVIVECKRITAGLNAVQQLRRYVEKIKAAKGVKKVIGYLAAPGITKNAETMLKDWGFKLARIDPPMRDIIDKSQQKKLNDFK